MAARTAGRAVGGAARWATRAAARGYMAPPSPHRHHAKTQLPDVEPMPPSTLALVDRFARLAPARITLAQLRDIARKPDSAALVQNAAFLQHELPVRLAQRVTDMQRLPFIVGCNPHVQGVYRLYLTSLEKLAGLRPVVTSDDEVRFSRLLGQLVDDHTDVVPKLARGMAECAKYISQEESLPYATAAKYEGW